MKKIVNKSRKREKLNPVRILLLPILLFLMGALFFYSHQQERVFAQKFDYYFEGMGISKVDIDQQGRLWVLSADYLHPGDAEWFGLKYYDGKDWIVVPDVEHLAGADDFSFDLDGNIWVTDFGVGIHVFDGLNWKQYTEANSPLLHNQIRNLAFDSEGRAWIGYDPYFGDGLTIFDGEYWQHLTAANSELFEDSVDVIKSDPIGRIWIVTDIGVVNIYDDGKWTTYRPQETGLSDNLIIGSLSFDKSGGAWIHTGGISTPGKLAHFNGQDWTYVDVPEGSWFSFIDQNDRIWTFGFFSGELDRVLNEGEWQLMSDIDGSDFNFNSSMVEDSNHRIWASTSSRSAAGLVSFAINSTSSASDIAVRSFLASGGFWCLEILFACLLLAALADQLLPAVGVTIGGLVLFIAVEQSGLVGQIAGSAFAELFSPLNIGLWAAAGGFLGLFIAAARTRAGKSVNVNRAAILGFLLGGVSGFIFLVFAVFQAMS